MKKVFSALFIVLLCASLASAQDRKEMKLDNFSRINFRVPGKLYLRQGSPQKFEIEGDREFIKELEIEVEGDRLIIGKENRWMDWGWNDDDRVTVYITIPQIEGLSVAGSGDLIGENKFTTADLDLKVSGSGSLKIEADASGDVEADVSGSGSIELRGKSRSFDSDVSGSGRVRIEETIAGNVSFGVSGSGKIEASGTARDIKTSISGSGRVYAANLEVESCEVRISGSGDVEINVKSELDAVISGSGTVSYKGNPAHINSHSSGSGKVRKL
jgi:hypothetical protein